MKAKLFLAIGLVLGLGMASAQAQVRTKPAEKARIAQGVRSGKLTPHETRRLMHDQRKIRRHRHMARRNDGHIGPRERRALAMEKRHASRKIYRYKHNHIGRK